MHCAAMISTHSNAITHCDVTMDILAMSLLIVMSQWIS